MNETMHSSCNLTIRANPIAAEFGIGGTKRESEPGDAAEQGRLDHVRSKTGRRQPGAYLGSLPV